MSSPRLTVRAIADILRKPKSNPTRALREQKYPSDDPQKFRIQYYQSVTTGIRRYYENGNDRRVLAHVRNKLLAIANKSRRDNNLRVLESFLASAHAQRRFDLSTNSRYSATTNRLTIGLSADMQAFEGGVLKIVYINCKATAMDREAAAIVAELAHWVLEENGIYISPQQIEVMDVATGRSLGAPSWRQSTITSLVGRAKTIASIWDQL